MNLEKNHGGQPNRGRCTTKWYLLATIFSIFSIFLSANLVHFFLGNYLDTDAPDVLFVLFSILSFHIVGVVTIGAILISEVPSGSRLKELNLSLDWAPTTFISQGFKLTLKIIPIILIVNFLIVNISKIFNIPITEDPTIFWLMNAPIPTVIVLALAAVIIAPISEELMFRLVLHKTIREFAGTRAANLFTSVIFAISHYRIEQILPLFILAMWLQKSLSKTKNLWIPIFIHAFFNGMMIVAVLLLRIYSNPIGK